MKNAKIPFILAAVAGLLIACLVVILWPQGSPEVVAEARGSASTVDRATAEANPRSTDPSTRGLRTRKLPAFVAERPPGPPVATPPDLGKLADAATPIQERWQAGETKWSKSVLELHDPAFASEERRECDREFGEEIKQPCAYKLDLVIARSGPAEGEVVYSRPSLLVEADSQDPPPQACQNYATCITKTRLGKKLPLPPGDESHVSVSQSLISDHLPERMKNPELIAKDIAFLKEATARDRQRLNREDPVAVHELEFHERELKYMEKYHASLAAKR